jgi:2-amino-4-hydroxy-6-hydroxymethyldihydropteridine diphosphokinase
LDQILIKDLLVRGIIGISDRERAQRQDILINITLYTDIRKGGESDDIQNCVNYRTVAKKTIAYVERSARYTVEALATDIARICLEEPGVERVRVRVEKPGAVRFAASVGVEIERAISEEQPAMHQAYLSLGSNIDPVKNILLAIEKLRQMVTVNAVSTIWETPAVGTDGPRFLNASAWISTPLSAGELKTLVIAPIEQELGRVRTEDKYAPRTIDIDILIYDEHIVDENLWTREFLAIPTAELRPDLVEPKSGLSLNEIVQGMKPKSTALPRPDLAIPPQMPPSV